MTKPDPAIDGLEPDRATAEAWLEVFSRLILDHIEGLPTRAAVGQIGAEGHRIAASLSVPIPEEPLSGGAPRLAALLEQAVDASFNTAGPGYLAYIPGGGLYATALADLVADGLNRFTGLAAAAPALCRLEADVLDWLARSFGYGPAAAGLFTSGGSLANFSAIVTARHQAFGESGELARAAAYTSTQAHHSIAKALGLAGVPPSNLRAVAVDARFRMEPEALRAAIRADRDRGYRPFLVVAAAGTTNTGAVDPLGPIAEVCAEERVWLHVDGAYGGAFVLCDEGRATLAGIERADSITFDPHKGMFLPYGTGCLLVRDGAKLRAAHHTGAAYLQDVEALGFGAPSPGELGPELSRPYRGLRLWLPLMLHGAAAFRSALAEKLVLARSFHAGLLALVAQGAGLEIVDGPQLSIVPFRLARSRGEALADWNRRNARCLDAINARGRVYLSSTLLPVGDGDAFTLRVCVLSFRTHAARIDAAIEDVAAALAASSRSAPDTPTR
jgi:aromatic-L-amino-acid decarboxylase